MKTPTYMGLDQNGNIKKLSDVEVLHPNGDSYFGGAITFKTKIAWPNVVALTFMHLAGFYGTWLVFCKILNLQFASPIGAAILGWISSEGVTIGAHRLWTHRSFKAKLPIRILLMVLHTTAGQNSLYTWVRDHRSHHKFTDTDADPHNAKRGLFYSHVGWLMMEKHQMTKELGKKIDLSDLEKDPVVMFNKRYFKILYFFFGFLIPVMIPKLLLEETLLDSIFIWYFARYTIALNGAWTVNSLAHKYGMKPFDRDILPTENGFVSFVTSGEGWHNYHHVFPWDYKTSEFGKHFNISKDIIKFFEKIGLAYDLKEASHELIRGRILRSGDGSLAYTAPVTINPKPVSLELQSRGWTLDNSREVHTLGKAATQTKASTRAIAATFGGLLHRESLLLPILSRSTQEKAAVVSGS